MRGLESDTGRDLADPEGFGPPHADRWAAGEGRA